MPPKDPTFVMNKKTTIQIRYTGRALRICFGTLFRKADRVGENAGVLAGENLGSSRFSSDILDAIEVGENEEGGDGLDAEKRGMDI